ncbi:MAG: hypothetical protein AVDCRST_MAG45-888 [uncultured Solirubrobacterales bacterium]|uniref:RNA polymerase ECF-type sigma factor n=1 Tax=uncultured Solirubrobacterales bacterium TaxID=768556 RepID=A0A6J4SHJ4_9ACTN|nr:MAG: hypothetical protein AVDCRST_MAG45-888 [uncultured Solirubrobacterales bacterium]
MLSDDRLAVEAKRGNEVAFEVIYDRHHRGLLGLCRHVLRSPEDAEDALQQAFASAFRALPGTDPSLQLKPWLYTIARNRCLSMLRARRELAVGEVESQSSTVGLPEEVEQRAELRDLLADLEHLPEQQKSALVLSELGALDHAHIAQVLDCETKQVKALVFQARSALIENRRARGIPCAEIRERLASASAGELRRGSLRRHLRQCSGCTEFRDDVRRQRKMLALALPVAPTLGLKESALAAAGIGGSGGAGGGGLIAALGASGAAKVATVGVAAGGAAGGLVAADPALVPRAQAAVEQAAGTVGGVVLRPFEGPGGSKGGGPAVSTSFDWDSAQAEARRESRSERRLERERSPATEPPPPPRGEGDGDEPGDAPAVGRAVGRPDGYGREGQGRGSRGRGREDRGSRSNGRGRDERPNRRPTPRLSARRRAEGAGRRLIRPGVARGADRLPKKSRPDGEEARERPSLETPRALPDRGKSENEGLDSPG